MKMRGEREGGRGEGEGEGEITYIIVIDTVLYIMRVYAVVY